MLRSLHFRTVLFVTMLLILTLGQITPALAQSPVSLMPTSRITVRNMSGGTIYVKVSKACGAGQDGYWLIPHGKSESWSRCVLGTVKVVVSLSRSDSNIVVWTKHTMKVTTSCNFFEYDAGWLNLLPGKPNCL